MAKELKRTDVSQTPELLQLAEEVQRTQQPTVLVKQAEELVVVTPVNTAKRSAKQLRPASSGKPITPLSLDAIYRSVPALPNPLSDKEMAAIAREEHAAHVAQEGRAAD